jgi:hypothetical protein
MSVALATRGKFIRPNRTTITVTKSGSILNTYHAYSGGLGTSLTTSGRFVNSPVNNVVIDIPEPSVISSPDTTSTMRPIGGIGGPDKFIIAKSVIDRDDDTIIKTRKINFRKKSSNIIARTYLISF